MGAVTQAQKFVKDKFFEQKKHIDKILLFSKVTSNTFAISICREFLWINEIYSIIDVIFDMILL